jgi:hypothetical protein
MKVANSRVMKTQIKYSSLDLHAERTVLGVMNEGGKMIGIPAFRQRHAKLSKSTWERWASMV